MSTTDGSYDKNKSELANKLEKVLESMTQEEFDIEWAKIVEMKLVGPTIEEYLTENK